MGADKQEDQKSYQRALRVVGRYLDSEPSYNVSISETADGFAVRSHSTSRRAEERVMHFEWDRLGDLDTFYAAGRGFGENPKRKRHQNLWENFPCGHERALRTLGSLLDSEDASSLSLDEVENGLDVSYMRPGQNATVPEKVQRVYPPEELCAPDAAAAK